MKCSEVRKELERLAFQHDPDPGDEIRKHLASCKACAGYMEENRLVTAIITGIRQREPILKDPGGLTEDIMQAIREDVTGNPPGVAGKSVKPEVITFLRRLMAAASVCLFLILSYEEYLVVDKISRLETQHATISRNSQFQKSLRFQHAAAILSADRAILRRYQGLITRSPLISIIQDFDSSNYTKER